MSRIARKLIKIPDGVTVTVSPDNNVEVKGSKGTLKRTFSKDISIIVENGELKTKRSNDSKNVRALHGTTTVLIMNMIKGVSEGFEKVLEAIGVGYRFATEGKKLKISLGFSHGIDFISPEGIKITIEGQNGLKIEGIDKELVGAVAAKIRSYRPPEPYKGKGVKLKDEVIIRKAGKAGKAAG